MKQYYWQGGYVNFTQQVLDVMMMLEGLPSKHTIGGFSHKTCTNSLPNYCSFKSLYLWIFRLCLRSRQYCWSSRRAPPIKGCAEENEKQQQQQQQQQNFDMRLQTNGIWTLSCITSHNHWIWGPPSPPPNTKDVMTFHTIPQLESSRKSELSTRAIVHEWRNILFLDSRHIVARELISCRAQLSLFCY